VDVAAHARCENETVKTETPAQYDRRMKRHERERQRRAIELAALAVPAGDPVDARQAAAVARDVELESRPNTETALIAALAEIPPIMIRRPGLTRATRYRVIREHPLVVRQVERDGLPQNIIRHACVEVVARSSISKLVAHIRPCLCAICRLVAPLWVDTAGSFFTYSKTRAEFLAMERALPSPEVWFHESTLTWHRREDDGSFSQLGTYDYPADFRDRRNRIVWADALGIQFGMFELRHGTLWPWDRDDLADPPYPGAPQPMSATREL